MFVLKLHKLHIYIYIIYITGTASRGMMAFSSDDTVSHSYIQSFYIHSRISLFTCLWPRRDSKTCQQRGCCCFVFVH